jgi:hypothetical protein
MTAIHHRGTVEGIARAAREINAALGVWLFLSTLLWPHTPQHQANNAIVGAAMTACALGALYFWRQLHVVNVVLSIWLFVSLFTMPGRSPATTANDMLVATLAFGFAVIPDGWSRPASV